MYNKGTKKLGLCRIVKISLFQVKCTFFMVFADISMDIRSLCKPIISYFTPIFFTLISYIS